MGKKTKLSGEAYFKKYLERQRVQATGKDGETVRGKATAYHNGRVEITSCECGSTQWIPIKHLIKV